MNSKDLNSINEAFVQATTKVVAEKTTESGKQVDELAGAAIRGTGAAVGGALKGVGYVAKKAGQAAAGATKWAGDKLDKRRDRKKAEKKADKKYKKIEGAEEGSETDPLGIGKTQELSGATRDVKKKGRHSTKTKADKKAEKKADKKTAKKESVTKIREADFGDPSRHGSDMMDQDLKPGDFVSVDGEDGEWIVHDIDGDPNDPNAQLELVQAPVDSEGITVSRNDVVKVSDDDVDVSGPVDDAEDWQSDDSPFEDSVKTMMDDYEARLSSNFGVRKVHEKDESGTAFKQPDENISEIDSKTQRPKGEVKADEKSKDVGDVKDDLQEPVEVDEKDDKKDKKVGKESINNSNKGNIMSEDKSIFDKLYEQVMGEDDEFGGDELGLPNGDGLDNGDEFGDEGEDEVTVTLSPDQVDALKAVVDQFPEPEDDEELGFGDDEPVDDGENFESVEEGDTQTTGKPTSDGTKPGVDPSDGGGKSTDPASDSLGGKSSGTGQAKVTDDDATTGKETGEGKKPGTAKNSGKPGKLKAASKT